MSKTDVVPFGARDLAKSAARFSGALGGSNDDLSAGVSGGFSVISIRGSKWRIKHSGEETLVTDAEGEPIPSLRVLLLKANSAVSKNYYEGGYVEGSSDEPDCWSSTGIKPDESVQNPVSPGCANCPKNAFGSRITENGKKAKACSDVRRVVVLPEGDLANERYGGPLLLRVPAASLSELSAYGKVMKDKGFPYNTVITRISFDPETAYPRLRFNAVRPLSEDEIAEVEGLLADSTFTNKVESILTTALELAPAQEVAEEASVFEEPPAPAAKPAVIKPVGVAKAVIEVAPETVATFGKPAAKPIAAAKPAAAKPAAVKPAPKPAPAPAPVEAQGELVEDDDLARIMEQLDALN